MQSLLLSLLFLFSGSLALMGQVQYVISVDNPTSLTKDQILELFEESAGYQNVALRGNMLTLTVPNATDYPILTIREKLANVGISAIEYKQTQVQGSPVAQSQTLETTQFKVYGNCGMCKDRIERAARSVKGVVIAKWNEDTSNLTLKYRPDQTEVLAIHRAIAAVGHDTDMVRAADAVYNDLHHCCKFERPATEK